jgi:hypothetical protein
MGVAVYPKLGVLLRSRRMSVRELERQIEARFGLAVDPKTLYRLASSEPVQRADLEIAGAAAAILGVGLGDLFDIEARPVESSELTESFLDPAQSRRLADLFDAQASRALTPHERDERDHLMACFARNAHATRVHEYAAQHNLPLDAAEREMAERLERAVARWDESDADTRSQHSLPPA